MEGEENFVLFPYNILPDNACNLPGLFSHRHAVKWQGVLYKTLFWIITENSVATDWYLPLNAFLHFPSLKLS